MHRMQQTYKSLLVGLTVVLGLMADSGLAQQVSRDRQVQIVAEGMCCKGCAQKVSGQLYAARGVKSVAVDLKTHIVTVSLPPQKSATLGQLWHAVQQGDGGPTKMITSEATFTLLPPKVRSEPGQPAQRVNSATQIVIDNLHCMGCAKKIGAQLYALKGVRKVSADLQRDTLTVESNSNVLLTPWQAIDAVMRAKERPLSVSGNYGTVSIAWATKRAPKQNHQAQLSTNGGIQR